MLVALQNARFAFVETDIFVKQLVADCMTHSCKEMAASHNHVRLDACCQYGADVDLGERENILARRQELTSLLHADAAAAPWFTTELEDMPDFPSGKSVRTARFGDGCVFLQHEKRGCAIHRAALENGWSIDGVKPHICRLFPLTYDDDTLLIADDYVDYSCAFLPDAPSLYRVQRETLASVFGEELVAKLDAIEASVLAEQPKRLPVVS